MQNIGELIWNYPYMKGGFYANLMSGVKACLYKCKYKGEVMRLELTARKWWVGLSVHKVP